MSDMVGFLRARLDEDEAVARCGAAELGGTWTADQVSSTEGAAAHIARWDPARVLAEVEAKRRIVDWFDPIEHPVGTLLALAQVYADHPDFDPHWTWDR